MWLRASRPYGLLQAGLSISCSWSIGWVLPPRSNSWIINVIWLYIALNRTPTIDCYWGGSTQSRGGLDDLPRSLLPCALCALRIDFLSLSLSLSLSCFCLWKASGFFLGWQSQVDEEIVENQKRFPLEKLRLAGKRAYLV